MVRNFNGLSTLLNGSPATPYYGIDGTRFQITSQPAAVQQATLRAALDKAVAAS